MTSIDTRPVAEKRGFAFLSLRERPLKPRSGAVTEVGDSRASRGLGLAATSVRAPVVAAVESGTARATAEVAAQVAHELKAPLTFIHVRPRPSTIVGRVRSQRHSVRALFRAHRALDIALPVATRWGVIARGEVVDGDPVDELVKVATGHEARLLVVGSRRRRFKRSVSRGVLETSAVPVVVADARPL